MYILLVLHLALLVSMQSNLFTLEQLKICCPLSLNYFKMRIKNYIIAILEKVML